MDMTALIIAIIGGGTVGVIFKSVYDRICKKHDRKDEVVSDIKWLKDKSRQRDIEVSQLKIMNLIQHSPKERKAIIDECEHYFLELKADSWVFGVVQGWARKEVVDIGYLEAAHRENSKEKYKSKKGGLYG